MQQIQVNYLTLSGRAIKALEVIDEKGLYEVSMVLLDELAEKEKIMRSMGSLIHAIHEQVGDKLYDLEVEDRMDEEIYKVLDAIYVAIEDAVIEDAKRVEN